MFLGFRRSLAILLALYRQFCHLCGFVSVESDQFVFENVSFRYKDEDVLRELSCKIPANSMTALVGRSGSVKEMQLIKR